MNSWLFGGLGRWSKPLAVAFHLNLSALLTAVAVYVWTVWLP